MSVSLNKCPASQYRKPELPYWGIERPEHNEDGFSIDHSLSTGTVYYMGHRVGTVLINRNRPAL